MTGRPRHRHHTGSAGGQRPRGGDQRQGHGLEDSALDLRLALHEHRGQRAVGLRTGTDLFRLRTSTDGAIAKVYVAANRRLFIRSDVSGQQVQTSATLPLNGWATVELCGTVGTAGTWDLLVNGTVVATTGWPTPAPRPSGGSRSATRPTRPGPSTTTTSSSTFRSRHRHQASTARHAPVRRAVANHETARPDDRGDHEPKPTPFQRPSCTDRAPRTAVGGTAVRACHRRVSPRSCFGEWVTRRGNWGIGFGDGSVVGGGR